MLLKSFSLRGVVIVVRVKIGYLGNKLRILVILGYRKECEGLVLG